MASIWLVTRSFFASTRLISQCCQTDIWSTRRRFSRLLISSDQRSLMKSSLICWALLLFSSAAVVLLEVEVEFKEEAPAVSRLPSISSVAITFSTMAFSIFSTELQGLVMRIDSILVSVRISNSAL